MYPTNLETAPSSYVCIDGQAGHSWRIISNTTALSLLFWWKRFLYSHCVGYFSLYVCTLLCCSRNSSNYS